MRNDDFIELHESKDEVKGDFFNQENVERAKGEIRNSDEQHAHGEYPEKYLVRKPPILQGNVELVETVATVEKMTSIESTGQGDLDDVIDQKKILSSSRNDGTSVTGVKRSCMTYEDQQPFVHVTYNSLPRQSKRRLEELLHHWSEWHAQQCSLSKDLDEVLESGDETYFPPLHVDLGPEKTSMVSFLMDNQVNEKQSKGNISLDGNVVPLYDREYALGLTSMDGLTDLGRGLQTINPSRCFNCGSYNHSLKECPKPRDNVAVNNARKQYQTKRNRPAGPRLVTRYYQNSPGGKYDGLEPGVLGLETRKLLNLGEFDPPPWLHRMREMGYPPGYLDPVDEDQPSGIIIYTDEETREEEDNENLKLNPPKLQKKMSVDFPGINAPIPEHADQRRWTATQDPASFDSSRNWSGHISNLPSKSFPNCLSHNQRWPRDCRDGFPGNSPTMFDHPRGYSGFIPSYAGESFSPMGDHSSGYLGFNPTYSSDPFSPRGDHLGDYSPFNFNSMGKPFSPRGEDPFLRGSGLERSISDRGRSSLFGEGCIRAPDALLPYKSSTTLWSPHDYGSVRFESQAYEKHRRGY